MKIIKDKRILKAMERRGHISLESPHIGGSQVDHNHNKPYRFEYKGKQYRIKYFDGSIFPFVTHGE